MRTATLCLGLGLLTLAQIHTPVLARDGSRTVSDHAAAGHAQASKDKSVFQGLKEELNHLNDPVTETTTIADQFLGDVNNALTGETNATGTPDITAGQAKSLEKAFDRATSTGSFSGHSGAVGSDDIGGIP